MNVIELEQGSVIHSPTNGTNYITELTVVLSSFGLVLSACALLFLILTACVFAEWRKKFKNQLLIQFMLSRFMYTFIRYFFDIMAVYDLCISADCIIYLDEITMIYTEMALIAWMFVFTKHMYSSLVTVFSLTRPSMWKVSMATWITPMIASVISFMVYRLQDGKDVLFFFIYLAVIKWPVLIANATLLIIILKSIKKKNKSRVDDNKSNARLVIVMNILISTFCFQQVFIDIYKLLHIILDLRPTPLIAFNIGLMYHCAFSITFWVLGNVETRKLWKNRCCCCTKSHKPVLLCQISRSEKT